MKTENLQIFRYPIKSKLYSQGNKDLKQEIRVIIKSKHFGLLYFSPKILKYITYYYFDLSR